MRHNECKEFNEMARTATITDEQILRAARAIFLEEGFGAQTAKIARKAKVSEGTIFKRFPTKEDLFFAALEIDRFPAWHAETVSSIGEGVCRENLEKICLGILLWFSEMLPRTIGAMGCPSIALKRGFPGTEHPILIDERKLREYLEHEVRLGRLRNCNLELLASHIMGSLTSYVFKSMVLGQVLTTDRLDEIAAGTVELIWNGIAPDKPSG